MWLTAAILSSVFAGLTAILAKCGIKKTDSDIATAMRTVVVLAFSWLMVFVVGSAKTITQINSSSLLFLILSGAATGASWMCYFKALSIGDVNKVVPIDKSSTILSVLLAIICFGETEHLLIKLISTFMLGAGIILMVEKKKNSNEVIDNTYILYAIGSAVFAALTSILGKVGITGVESNLGTAIRTVVVLIMAWAIVFMKGKQSQLRHLDKKELIFLFFSGIATGASWLCYYYAIQNGVVSIVVPIDKMSILNGIQDMYAGVIENHNRNELLVSDALKLVQEGRTPILLTERKEHAVLLAGCLSDQVQNVFLLIGSEKQKDKREKLAALQNVPDDENVVVVATGKYIGEGFDSPRLDTLLLAMPISWKGTLAQYAGRLHRNYKGKQEVRIYDYVDIHVPTLERMYHKRLKGYAELGYQVKFGAADQAVSVIYDGYSSMLPFEQDLDDAARSVVIVSPYLQKGRIVKLLPSLQKAIASGVKIEIHTRTADSRELSNQESVYEAIEMMEQTGIVVHTHKELNQRYAVVDESIVWYGGVDFLAFGRKDTDVLRFKNPDIAGEFLSLSGHAEGEQLVMEDVSM